MTKEEIINQLESLKRHCRMMSLDEDADVGMWLGYEQALSRAIYHLKCLYADTYEQEIAVAALSCENCAHYGKYCDDPSPYEGKTGHIAGVDFCELYWPKEEEHEEYYAIPEAIFGQHELTDEEKKEYEDYFNKVLKKNEQEDKHEI